MSYLVDTCSFIWYVLNDKNLSQRVKNIILGSDSVYISYATLWEIAIKQTTGKLKSITMSAYEIAELCRDNGIIILPLKLSYLERIKQLPLIHKDPFDRIIIATAIEEDYTLLTNDSEIIKYKDVKTLW